MNKYREKRKRELVIYRSVWQIFGAPREVKPNINSISIHLSVPLHPSWSGFLRVQALNLFPCVDVKVEWFMTMKCYSAKCFPAQWKANVMLIISGGGVNDACTLTHNCSHKGTQSESWMELLISLKWLLTVKESGGELTCRHTSSIATMCDGRNYETKS